MHHKLLLLRSTTTILTTQAYYSTSFLLVQQRRYNYKTTMVTSSDTTLVADITALSVDNSWVRPRSSSITMTLSNDDVDAIHLDQSCSHHDNDADELIECCTTINRTPPKDTSILHRSPFLPSVAVAAAAPDDDCEEEPVVDYETTTSSCSTSDETDRSSSSSCALVILNAPIRPSPLFEKLWKRCGVRVCADGGANRLYKATVGDNSEDDSSDYYVPDLIRGDLDSLKPDVRDYYAKRGTKVERDSDQNANDLDKSLYACSQLVPHIKQCFVYGAFGGRFDQEMASMQALYKWSDEFREGLWLYNDDTCAFLLKPSVVNRIQLHSNNDNNTTMLPTLDNNKLFVGEGPTCGLIPMGWTCESVTTTGFQWNLDHDALAFGGLVSTSNKIIGHDNDEGAEDACSPKEATVVCSHPLVFTAQVHSGLLDEWDE